MRVPVSVLRKLVPLPADLDSLVHTMNARVSEVEHVIRFPARAAFAGVSIVEAVRPVQRQGEHTRWEMVGGHHIVVGDRFGVEAGGRYAAVLAGRALPDGTAIDEKPVAGMASDGALVSEAMLGIGKDAARPLGFGPDTALDANAWDALELDDVVLEFDLEPNRPDLYSLLGMARDAAAIWSHAVLHPAALDLATLPRASTPRIELRTPRARGYLAVAMTGVKVGPSPQWLQNVVRKLGMRPINNVVDAANLAMFELGQPLHTFDAKRLHSGAIVLRMAEPGEKITTLDAVERSLTDECLLVCDGERPVAIAGVMGDATSEVDAGTTDVLIESAAFDMAAVRRASRRLALRSEASLRFEKGLPFGGLHRGAARLAWLLGEVAGATPVSLTEVGEAPPPAAGIRVDRARIRSRLGMDVPDTEIDRILTAAGATLEGGVAYPPEFRPDLRIFEDLIEEVGRVFGYDHVRAEAPRVELQNPRANPSVVVARRARRVLTAAGWDEVYLPVWIGDAEVERFGYDAAGLVKLINPLAENLVYFRPSVLPALVEAAVQNRKELTRFGIFEVGKVWSRGADGALVERAHLAGIAMGEPLLAVRDVLLAFGAASGASLELQRPLPGQEGEPAFHPGRSFTLGDAGPSGRWASAGELHPRLVRAFGLREAPVAFAVDLQALFGLVPAPVRFVAPPRFPSVEFDLNVTVPPKTEVATVLGAVPRTTNLLSSGVVDIYELPAGGVESGARLTLRFVFNAGDRSLTQEEGASAMEAVRGALAGRGWKVG
ncbi:MAG: phenylalanine--tRNA ligase subunit beta [Pseudomonadota bacterium]|nr:phenylalanine--tRNA ligase subunit beta [Pseudomonadota bacterium]